MERRRHDDQVPVVLVARPAVAATTAVASPGLQLSEFRRGRFAPSRSAVETSAAPLFMLDAGNGDLLLVTGAEVRRLPREPDGSIADLAETEAEALRQRIAIAKRKQQFGDGFVTFVERLNRARSAADVYDALLQHTPELVGGYGAILAVAGAGGGSETELYAFPADLFVLPRTPLHLEALLPRPVPGPITRADTRPNSPFAPFAALFTQAGARQIGCVAIGDRALLLLVERREDREFSGEDWFRLQTIAHHADGVLERLRLSAEVHMLRMLSSRVEA